jgi:hypothetical protein
LGLCELGKATYRRVKVIFTILLKTGISEGGLIRSTLSPIPPNPKFNWFRYSNIERCKIATER